MAAPAQPTPSTESSGRKPAMGETFSLPLELDRATFETAVLDAQGEEVALCSLDQHRLHAARLARAVNAHDALLKALREVIEFCDDPNGSEKNESLAAGMSRLLPAARAAVTLAERSAK